MFYLLPDSEKKSLKMEYFFRLGTVVLSMISILLIVADVFIVSSCFVLKDEQNFLEEQIVTMKKTFDSTGNQQYLDSVLNSTKTNLIKLLPLESLTYPTDVISSALSGKKQGVHIQGIVFTRNDDQTLKLQLIGVSSNRDTLISFVNNLKKNPLFIDTDLPVSNLAKNTNVDFNLTLTSK